MAELTRFDVSAPLMNQWGGEWHGLESRVRELELMVNNEVRSGGVVKMRYSNLMGQFAVLLEQGINDAERQQRIRQWQAEIGSIVNRRREPDTSPALSETKRLGLEHHPFTHANVQRLFDFFHNPGLADPNLSFDQAQIRHLRHFILQAAKQVLLFYQVFTHGFGNTLIPSREYPPIHVNAALMRQIATDLRIGEQAILQRQRGIGRYVTWQSYALYMADLLAYTTIQPLQQRGIIPPQTKVITYLQRRTDIRLMPYYDMLFIGLPSSMINVYDKPPRNFLAIPHEVGHFLYMYGTVDRIPPAPEAILQMIADQTGNRQLQDEVAAWHSSNECRQLQPLVSAERVKYVDKEAIVEEIWEQLGAFLTRRATATATNVTPPQLSLETVRRVLTPKVFEALSDQFTHKEEQQEDWREHWLEELFADTFGCLIAGPYNVLGFQELLAEGHPGRLLESDGKHPTPALRPLVQSEILRQIDRRNLKSYKQIPDLLDRHWQQYLNNQGPAPLHRDVHQASFIIDGQSRTGRSICNDLVEGIGWILDLFAELFGDQAEGPANWECWSGDVTVGTAMPVALQQLREHFDAFYFQISPTSGQPEFQRSTSKPPMPPHDQNVPETPYQQQVTRLVNLWQLKTFADHKGHESFIPKAETVLSNWANGQTFEAEVTFSDWLEWEQKRIKMILADPQEGARLLRKVIAVLRAPDQRFAVEDWIGAFAVPGWSTEGPSAIDHQ